MSHQHLNIEQRNLLYQLSQEGNLSQRQMAVLLGCHQSTISRELRRNQSSLGCYLPETAQAKSETRRKNSKHPFKNVSESALELVKKGLKDYYSPEQIAGRLKRDGQESLSHETIYQMIYQNYRDCGKYQEYLRQGRGKRKSRGGAKSKRGGIPGRVDICERPAIADRKTEIGHWESDTMIGGNHLGVLVTHVDKASKFLVAGLAKNKTASEINRVTEKLFQEIAIEKRKTFTCDNGKEFCGHQELSQKLGADFYFATPYHSWERGLNEHTNGLLRQFFPKGTNFKIVKPEQVERAVNLINNRPRKCLDYRTPNEVFYEGRSDSDAIQT
jgi:IS30 family transposase